MAELEPKIKAIFQTSEERMQKTEEAFKKDMANIRSTRASSSMIDSIQVEYYGTLTPLNQLASISVPDSRTLLVNPFDKSVIGDIEKSIFKSDIGITPQNDGTVLRLILPELNMERRQELVKQLKARLEDARVSFRNIRRDTNEEIKKLKSEGISEDESKSQQENVQKLTDRFIAQCETLSEKKEESILHV